MSVSKSKFWHLVEGFTFPANREVFHDTLSIIIHHVSQILHGGDGVITNTVQNNAWKQSIRHFYSAATQSQLRSL